MIGDNRKTLTTHTLASIYFTSALAHPGHAAGIYTPGYYRIARF